jgi:uncharacterized membrane protein HdeD (DUF308 family)
MSQPPPPPISPIPSQQLRPQPLPAGLAIASLILGILSILSFCVSPLAVALGIIAVILGVIALSQVKSGRAGGSGMAKGGLICGSLGIAIGIIVTSLLYFGGSYVNKHAEELQKKLEQKSQQMQEQSQKMQKAADKMQKAAEAQQKNPPAP